MVEDPERTRAPWRVPLPYGSSREHRRKWNFYGRDGTLRAEYVIDRRVPPLPVFKNRVDLMIRHEKLPAETLGTRSRDCSGPANPEGIRMDEKITVPAVEESYSVPS